MPNVTISLDEETLRHGRLYARKNHTSLNDVIRRLLSDATRRSDGSWLEDCFLLADRTGADSKGKKWKRGDLYRD